MTVGVDFFRSGALPAPQVSAAQAEQIAAAQFGLVARARPLGSQQDSNETWAICDRMLELGVVIQPTGDRMCVLKVKPPLCLDTDGADFFAATLDRVLTEGWGTEAAT